MDVYQKRKWSLPYSPKWRAAGISIEVLGAISGGDSSSIQSPSIEFGDPLTDLVTFEIPRFQRGLRWSEPKRSNFLNSLKKGIPIGAIVLARRPDAPSASGNLAAKKWLVLDGQQRIFATQELIKTFWTYPRYDLEGLSPELTILAETLKDVDGKTPPLDDVKHAIVEVTRADNKAANDSDPFLSAVCQRGGFHYPPTAKPRQEALAACTTIRIDLNTQFDGLRKYPVTALLITPDPTWTEAEQLGLLTDIFTSLNDFVKLDKYELIAARWVRSPVVWPPQSFSNTAEIAYLFHLMAERISSTYENLPPSMEFDPNIEGNYSGPGGDPGLTFEQLA